MLRFIFFLTGLSVPVVPSSSSVRYRCADFLLDEYAGQSDTLPSSYKPVSQAVSQPDEQAQAQAAQPGHLRLQWARGGDRERGAFGGSSSSCAQGGKNQLQSALRDSCGCLTPSQGLEVGSKGADCACRGPD